MRAAQDMRDGAQDSRYKHAQMSIKYHSRRDDRVIRTRESFPGGKLSMIRDRRGTTV